MNRSEAESLEFPEEQDSPQRIFHYCSTEEVKRSIEELFRVCEVK